MEATVKMLIGSCVGIYGAAFLCLIVKRRKTGMFLFGAGWAANAIIFLTNWILCGDPPLGNMYHVLIFLSTTFFPVYLLLAYRDGLTNLAHYFAFAAVFPVAGAFFMSRDVFWKRMPALQSAWFVPHVFSYMVAYSLAAIAFSLVIVKIFRRYVFKTGDDGLMAEAGYQVIRLGFPFMTFGLLSGALWAEEAWGHYWSWDAKETWALITWIMYVIYFHCRRHVELKKYEDLSQVLAFISLLATFILVNILPRLGSSLHSYAR